MTAELASQETTFPVHPAADLFPLIEGEEFDALVADIRAHGQIEPITVDPDGQLLDGRNRVRACRVLGIQPTRRVFEGDPYAYIASANIYRRNLTKTQLAMIAAEMANLQQGANRFTMVETPSGVSTKRADVAKLMGVGTTPLDRAKTVLREGTPDLISLAKADGAPLTTLARVAKELPAAEQDAYVEKVRTGAHPVKVAPSASAKPLRVSPPKFGGNRRKHVEQIEALIQTLSGAVAAFDGLPELDASVTEEEATRLTSGLTPQIRSLNRINTLIKERIK